MLLPLALAFLLTHFLSTARVRTRALSIPFSIDMPILAPGTTSTTSTTSANAATPTAYPPNLQEIVDNLIFDVSLSAFQTSRAAQIPAYLNWTSDGCTGVDDTPGGFDFLPGCQRHDFAYRNYRYTLTSYYGREMFTDNAKAAFDQMLKDNLDGICAEQESVIEKESCRAFAQVYYKGVRMFGNVTTTGGLEGLFGSVDWEGILDRREFVR